MSDNDRNEAREAAARAFTGLCCVTVADEVCEDCVGALLYLASMHEAIEYLHLRDFAQQNTIRNLRRRLSRHEAHEDVVERMRVTARDAAEKLGLSRGPKTRAEVLEEMALAETVEEVGLWAARLLLLEVMRRIGREAYCSGWLTGLERSLYRCVVEQSTRFGQGFERQDLLLLTVAQAMAGGWWVWERDPKEPVFVEGWEPGE